LPLFLQKKKKKRKKSKKASKGGPAPRRAIFKQKENETEKRGAESSTRKAGGWNARSEAVRDIKEGENM